MRMHRVAALVAMTLLAAGCGTPGGDSGDNAKKDEESNANAAKVDVAKAGDVTLTVWDQEVRGGQAKQIKRLNQAFQEKYPNVTIKRVAKSFTDLNTTLKLAVSGPKAPDVVEANQGRPVMGQLVKGGLLAPMDAYADAYGWEDRWSKTLLELNRFSSDGQQFGSGNLYGVSQMGEIVGVYYNKDKASSVPQTFGEFEQMLADAMGDKVGFFLMPGPEAGRDPVSLGGESLPWGITKQSKNADVAAAYIDFLTNPEAAQVLVETDNLPAMKTDAQPSGGVSQEVSEAWRALNDADGLTPYIDYATPTFYDDFAGAVQRLLPGRLEPREFVADVQSDYAKFSP